MEQEGQRIGEVYRLQRPFRADSRETRIESLNAKNYLEIRNDCDLTSDLLTHGGPAAFPEESVVLLD